MTTSEPIRKFLRRQLLRAAKCFEGSDSFDVAFDGVPDAEERAVMSAHKMARAAADAAKNQGKDSVAFILLSYELQLKLAKEQSTATYRAALIGLVGIGVGAFMQSLMQQPDCRATDESRPKTHKAELNAVQPTPVPAASRIPASAQKPNEHASANAGPPRT